MSYSEAEIKAFAEKDLRISKLAIIKSLIEKLDSEEIYEPEEKLFPLADRYVNYVYEKINIVKLEAKVEDVINWVTTAESLNLAIPKGNEIKALDTLIDKCKKSNPASANHSALLVHIMNKYGRYPTTQQNVAKVLETYLM